MVWAKIRRIPSVLLDGGSRVNIIIDILMQTLGLEKQPEAVPFKIKMAKQQKVNLELSRI